MSDRSLVAGDPIAYAAKRKPQEELLAAAEAALGLLDRIDAHAPEGLAFGGEGRVRKQLRAAIQAAKAEADARAWADAESAEEAEALDELRATLGHVPTERERSAFLEGYREARKEHAG